MNTFDSISVERVRAYWDARPCNLRHSAKPVGSREYFDEVEARKYFVEPHIPGFADFPRWRDKDVLEIGCGIGTDTINFARHGARVTAVDLSEKSLEITRARAAVFDLSDRIRLFCADAERLTHCIPLEQYDLIYSFGVIHHSPHPDHILSELRNYLKPGGILKIMVYHRHSWKVLWILLFYGRGRLLNLEQIVARYSEAQTGCPVTYTYSRRAACELIESRDFKVLDIRTDHIMPYRIADYVQYRYVKAWYFRWMPAFLFRSLERAFGWHLTITATRS